MVLLKPFIINNLDQTGKIHDPFSDPLGRYKTCLFCDILPSKVGGGVELDLSMPDGMSPKD